MAAKDYTILEQFLNNDISLLEYIENAHYHTYELPTDTYNKFKNKVKNMINFFNEDAIKDNRNELITLIIKSKDETYDKTHERFEIKYIKDNKDDNKKCHISFKEILNKKVINKFNNTYYLLGEDYNGVEYYLEHGTFDCDWYWSGGYIITLNKYWTDIESHQHYDTAIINGEKLSTPTGDLSKIFKNTTLRKDEIWHFHELMREFYIAKEAMEMAHRGGARVSSNPNLRNKIENEDIYNYYKDLISDIHEEIDKLFRGE